MHNPHFQLAFLIPVYNHEHAIAETLRQALAYRLPVLLVDDGSDDSCRETLVSLAKQHAGEVMLIRLEHNSGKGAAIKEGFRYLLKEGFTHAIQVDADGQHDIADLPKFIAASEQALETLIIGYPQYDESVPKVRLYARYLTHVWVWINTLSFSIKDSMCGFRLYPLGGMVSQLDTERCGDRMDFDTEVLVRWLWRGGKVVNVPVNVRYPLDGVSHFNVVRDNVLISLMHSRLFFGMLKRFPGMIWRKFSG